MKPPQWLPEFPFLQKQWPAIVGLSKTYPSWKSHDLNLDWSEFSLAYEQNHTVIDWFAQLRQFRKTRLAYLAYHDLFAPLSEHLIAMNKVSDLADLLIQKAHQIAAAEMFDKYGHVKDVRGEPVEMIICALGKLGSRELNYSSDIDLVFLYNHEGTSDGKRSLGASKYFTRLGQRVIKLLDHFTEDGLVYRVDMRLRPFGSAGSLVCSVSALQQYLQYEGREWERFAWMRSRVVVGQPIVAEEVNNKIKSFVYRKHLDYTVFNALAKIKSEIADHLDYEDDDLKQGVGGIRAVEFIVQSLQLVFAGRNIDLQGTEISQQIKKLTQASKLTASDAAVLNQAWLWLRKLENISQVVADQATHQIPDNPGVKQVICEVFDYQDWFKMDVAINDQRFQVEKMFDQLFAETKNQQQLTSLHKQQLQEFMQEFSSKRLPRTRQEEVEQLLQSSLQMASEFVVADFLVLVKKILTRPNYILMLLKEPYIHQSVLDLMAKHPYFVSTLQNYPVLLEQLFEREVFSLFTSDELTCSWQSQVAVGTERWMEALRCFKLEYQFNLILAWSEKQISQQLTVGQMTKLAVFVVSEVVKYSHQEMVRKLGKPHMNSEQMIIIAYGSAAMKQMTVGSDLDLVFIVDADQLCPDDYLFAQKWVRRIIHHLTVPMYHGKLYELDMQLRPNGNSGALVTTKREFAKYQAEKAWIWEHAAMVKSRVIYGSEQQVKWYQDLRSEVLGQQRHAKEVDQALLTMQNKLHQSDQQKNHFVDFRALAVVLKNSHQFPQLTTSDLSVLQAELIRLNLLDTKGPLFVCMKKDPAS